MPSIVAIDLETTGLDPQKDAIIEIAAVRFSGTRVEAEWTSLINPARAIPPLITQLTGITNDMVRNAPPIKAVIQELAAFIGDSPVVGHNVQFDLGFLHKQGILELAEPIDTYELAAVLMPTASRYNLGSLGQILGILIPNSHRAMDDARLAHAVYMQLYERAIHMPLELLAEIVRDSETVEWDAGWFFSQIMRARSRQPIEAKHAQQTDYGALFAKSEMILAPPLTPPETLTPLDVDELAALLEYGGPFARYFAGYEQRSQQVEMLRAVTRAFSDGYHLMVEAGTGTGKSFAYLVPAALWAIQNNLRVVISTNTITLQEQLINKDIPDLRNALGIDLRAVVLKGRSNYLCPRRLDALRKSTPGTADEIRVMSKVLVWLSEGGSGDRSEINLNGPSEREVWSRLSAEDEGCKAEVCMSRTGGACPFYRSRMASQSAHLIIVNHALLLSDVITGNRVLPEYSYLIVDEGHHLESASTNALSYKITQNDLARMLRELGGASSGILGRALTQVRDYLNPSELAAMTVSMQRATDLAFRLENQLTYFLKTIEYFMDHQRDGAPVSSYGQQVRILPATRTLADWTEVEMSWDAAAETLGLLLTLAGQVHKDITDSFDDPPEVLEDTIGNLGNIIRRLTEAQAYLAALVLQPDSNYIYWVEIQPNTNRLALQIAPLHIGPLMEQFLWHEKSSIVVTSATLTTQGEFEYLKSRLNADEADELVLGSPFDYENSTLLFLPNDIPEPNDANGYQRAVDQSIVRLAKSSGGRMLVLFTSYAQLRKTSQAITSPLQEADIQVYEQGEGASANTLLETFRGTQKAVLLGTRAFWEGVDIPGDALSVLVIVKLPFDVPTDPIIAARSETFDDPFNEYHLPEAILRFRQGFGRLIRTQTDRGVVAVLDKRILTKRYGRSFLESLPDCKKEVGSLHDLPSRTARWLDV
ncbi:MAG TPA: helicase C-terminal domain-containing protein [Bellilinea sp.]|nr:helicase C-terminal domain-containing protein [Bellilinea sp.]